MPNRILKESICTSDSINRLSWFEEVVFYRLIVNCDDYGRFDGRGEILKSRLFPLKDGKITVKSVMESIHKLATVGLVALYEYEGKPYLQLSTWDKHQQIRAKKSRFPAPDSSCKHLLADDGRCPRNPIQSESESESNTREGAKAPRAPARMQIPTLAQLEAYCAEQGLAVQAAQFRDYYEANGWRVGKNPMRDWKAALRSWARREHCAASAPQKQNPSAKTGEGSSLDLERIRELMHREALE